MYMETLTQRLGIINGVTPQTINNATVTTTGIDMSKFKRVFFFLYIGATAGRRGHDETDRLGRVCVLASDRERQERE